MTELFEATIHAGDTANVPPLDTAYRTYSGDAETWVKEQLASQEMAVMGRVVRLELSEITATDIAVLLNTRDVDEWELRFDRDVVKTFTIERVVTERAGASGA